MRLKIMIGLTVLVLLVLNYSIYQKEEIIQNGETVLLELAPVDPRSLIQGDYMRLRYAIENDAANVTSPNVKSGYMVISINPQQIASFVRFDDETPLTDNEKRLYYHRTYSRVRIVPNSFFFQEGHADRYQNARYGVFKFDDNGNHILTDLVDGP
ncbi:GDYXXLXY domain-containing protein [Kiloniella sp. EL199]|uniref:GDYXXLXY domain-containing protein n=1 Tax=Kiloniella sp. EL199 TaxID=2107581 RepID=UPI000EA3DE68|nr:GDYXXLXY domain-containing protein [Kiloniella sp. EL199]